MKYFRTYEIGDHIQKECSVIADNVDDAESEFDAFERDLNEDCFEWTSSIYDEKDKYNINVND